MAELKVQVVSLTSELRGDKDEYMDDLRKENLNYENDNMRMYTMGSIRGLGCEPVRVYVESD
jgi:hypothetical protein